MSNRNTAQGAGITAFAELISGIRLPQGPLTIYGYEGVEVRGITFNAIEKMPGQFDAGIVTRTEPLAELF